MLLDLSAAFDTVDHNILLDRLENWVGFSGTVLSCFRSYLEARNYFVSISICESEKTAMPYEVPQGSILGPVLFNLYMLPLGQILTENNVSYHNYADDTQIYLVLSPSDFGPIYSLLQCLDKVHGWTKFFFN